MDWDNFINSDLKPEYVVGVGLICYREFLELEKEFNNKILSIQYIKDCKKKEVNRLFKLMLMARLRNISEIPCYN